MNTKNKLFINNIAKNLFIAGLMFSPLTQFNTNRTTEGRIINIIDDTYKPSFIVSIIEKGHSVAEKLGLAKPQARFRELSDNGKPLNFFYAITEKKHKILQKIDNVKLKKSFAEEPTLYSFKECIWNFKQGMKNIFKPSNVLRIMAKNPISTTMIVGIGVATADLAIRKANKDAAIRDLYKNPNKAQKRTAKIKRYAKITKEGIKKSIGNLITKFQK